MSDSDTDHSETVHSETVPGVELAVQVDRLSRAFRGKQALNDVTLHIPVGTIFGLVGLNGAGKTTLIRHLIGGLDAKHGSVLVLGDNPVTNPEGVLKKVGLSDRRGVVAGLDEGWRIDRLHSSDLSDLGRSLRGRALRHVWFDKSHAVERSIQRPAGSSWAVGGHCSPPGTTGSWTNQVAAWIQSRAATF